MADGVDPWAAFRVPEGGADGVGTAPTADPWVQFRMRGDPQYAHLSVQDLRNMAASLPEEHPAKMELRRRNAIAVASAPERKEPDEFDVRAQNSIWRKWAENRSLKDRALDAAAFAGSFPVRALTQGHYGLGDVVGLVSPSGGRAISGAERDFARENPNFMWGLGAIGEVSAGLTGVAPTSPAAVTSRAGLARARATSAANDAAAAERLGTQVPGFAYNEGPVASIPKQLSETPLIGSPARRAMEGAIDDAASAAEGVASRFGDARTPEQVGRTAQDALNRFKDGRPADILDDAARNLSDGQISDAVRAPARDTSLKSKQAVLYERAWRHIPEMMREGRSVKGGPRVMGGMASTREVLRGIIDRNTRMAGARAGEDAGRMLPVTGGLLGRVLSGIDDGRMTYALQTMRDIRSEIRRLASGMGDTEKNVLKHSDLERLQSAITQDMTRLLQNNADAYRAAGDLKTAASFERSIRLFRQADRFTRLSAQRLETVEQLFNASSAESLSRSIVAAATNKGRGNLQMLRTLRRVLRPEEMSQIASGIIRDLGAPVGSARGMTQDLGFSVQSFITRWENMSPEARSLLFGGPHRAAVDDLVRVANRLANIEALVNTSRSGTNTLNVGTVLTAAGAVATGAIDTLTAGLGSAMGGFGTAYMMSRPAYARWMVRYLDAKATNLERAASRPIPMREIVRQLAAYAKQDPNLTPIYEAVAAQESKAK